MLDLQSLGDLGIFDQLHPDRALFKLIDHTRTDNGMERLKSRLKQPISDRETLLKTQEAIRYLQANIQLFNLPVANDDMYYLERYLESNIVPVNIHNKVKRTMQIVSRQLTDKSNYFYITSSAKRAAYFMFSLQQFLTTVIKPEVPEILSRLLNQMEDTINLFGLQELKLDDEVSETSMFVFDHAFRATHKRQVSEFLEILYELDALCSLAKFSHRYNLVFPEITEDKFELKGLYHLQVRHAIPNDIDFNEAHCLFLTGANMTGKSTLIRAICLSVYFAHLGIGVPAVAARIPLFADIVIAINKTDDLQRGYSHFMSEIKRVKLAVEKVNEGRKVFAVFDELFSGTNTEDAAACLSIVLNGMAKRRNGFFVFTSHLAAILDELPHMQHVQRRYLEVLHEGEDIICTYKLKEGVARDRIGLYTLRKEGLEELLK
jgi:DNA mismatch repair protein MutS